MLGARRGAEMRLQRHVAEILQRDDAELVRVAKDARHRHRHRGQQACDVHERQLLEVDRLRMDGQHLRRRVAKQHAEVRRSDASPVSGTTFAPLRGEARLWDR